MYGPLMSAYMLLKFETFEGVWRTLWTSNAGYSDRGNSLGEKLPYHEEDLCC